VVACVGSSSEGQRVRGGALGLQLTRWMQEGSLEKSRRTLLL
jgi:hypothetical protein